MNFKQGFYDSYDRSNYNYKVTNNYISKIGPNVQNSVLLKNITLSDNLTAEIKNANTNQTIVGTGSKVIIKNKADNKQVEEYNCLIYGDVDGDGKISAIDYTLIKNNIMDVKKIEDNSKKLSADVDGDNKISAIDYTLIKNHIMDVKKIETK